MVNDGNELYQLLIQLTGVDEPRIKLELNSVLGRLGLSPATLTMDDVRKAMLVYLEDLSASLTSDAAFSDLETFEEDPKRIEA